MGCGGLSHLGDLMFHKKTLHEMWCVSKWAASHQLPIAEAFWTIWTVSAKEWWDLTQNLMQICCSTCWVMLIAMATPWHLPPPLTSTLKLSLFTHVHSSLLSLAATLHQCCPNCFPYIKNGWTVSDLIYSKTKMMKSTKISLTTKWFVEEENSGVEGTSE